MNMTYNDDELMGGGNFNMNYVACEQFMDFCDEMMIAEEGVVKNVVAYAKANFKKTIITLTTLVQMLINRLRSFKKVNITRKNAKLYYSIMQSLDKGNQSAEIITSVVLNSSEDYKNEVAYSCKMLGNIIKSVESSQDFLTFMEAPKDSYVAGGDVIPVNTSNTIKALNRMTLLLGTMKNIAARADVDQDKYAKAAMNLVVRFVKLKSRVISKVISFSNNIKSQEGHEKEYQTSSTTALA